MVFDGFVEVRPGIEEACNSCIMLCEDLDDCWQTEDSWVGLITESFHGGSRGITGDGNAFLFEFLWLLLRYWFSRRSVMWRPGWLLTNRGQLRWIDDWIILWKRNRYHRLWQLVALWVTVVAIKAPIITRIRSPPTLIVPGSTFVAPPKTPLGTWHDEYNMSLWWDCVPVIVFVNVHHKVRAKFLAR